MGKYRLLLFAVFVFIISPLLLLSSLPPLSRPLISLSLLYFSVVAFLPLLFFSFAPIFTFISLFPLFILYLPFFPLYCFSFILYFLLHRPPPFLPFSTSPALQPLSLFLSPSARPPPLLFFVFLPSFFFLPSFPSQPHVPLFILSNFSPYLFCSSTPSSLHPLLSSLFVTPVVQGSPEVSGGQDRYDSAGGTSEEGEE